MKETIHGKITFSGNIDITDPCYDEDVWCRINNFPLPAGEYECYTLKANDKETHGFGERIARIGIRKDKSEMNSQIGLICVDAGMAGFFNCDNKVIYEDILDNEIKDVYLYDNAFVSSSGYGDGRYAVYAGYKNGELVELFIDFI